jgi:hypothetical protein
MTRARHPLLAVLGLGHLALAIVLAPTALFFGSVSIVLVAPMVVWLVVLGIRLVHPTAGLRRQLLVTHLAMLPFAGLLVAYGVFALREAARSAESGGGLLGAFGLIPIVMGLLAAGLSVVSLAVSRSRVLDEARAGKPSAA